MSALITTVLDGKTYIPDFKKTIQQYLINTAHVQLSADRTNMSDENKRVLLSWRGRFVFLCIVKN
jgi:hypothetical protein